MALVVGAASLWLLLASLPWPARTLTAFLLVPMPALAYVQMKMLARLEADQLPRLSIYISSGIMLWGLAIAAIIAASASDFTPSLIGIRGLEARLLISWTIFGLATAALLYALGRYFGVQESPYLIQLLPRSVGERVAFIGLSITAGICEELVFRGFLISALTVPTGSLAAAAAISTLVFGVLHSYQRVIGVLRAGILGLALTIPFLMTGSLLPSILAHIAIDLTGGLFLGRYTQAAHRLHS
ncbi:MAG: CPBP family intramembrane glutamic endopeptidase [Longimicrobiales bacterium]